MLLPVVLFYWYPARKTCWFLWQRGRHFRSRAIESWLSASRSITPSSSRSPTDFPPQAHITEIQIARGAWVGASSSLPM